MFCTIHFWMILSMPVNHPKEDVCIIHFGWLHIFQNWMFCTIHFWMITHLPELVLYNPLLDDYVCVKLF